MSFTVAHDGEWFPVARRGNRIACCDCALAHRVEFRVRAGHIQMRVWRDRAATRRRRRHMKASK